MEKTTPRPQSLAYTLAAAGFAGLFYALKAKRTQRCIRGQVAIVTGGSSGLGLSLAHELGRAGLRLVLAARDGQQLADAKHELLSSGSVANGSDILVVPCDLSDKHQAVRLIDSALNAFHSVDLLINDAGVIEVGPVEDQAIEAFENAMSINFFGAVYTTLAVLPHMLSKKNRSIVNISSIGGKVAVPHLLPYVASKFALTGFSEGLHSELRQKGIRVTTVCPGLMRTGGENHAHFTGNVRAEQIWFRTSARIPGLSADVNRAAKLIVAAVQEGRAEITITPQAWIAARFAGIAPETTQILASLVNAYLLPKPSRS